LVASLSIQTTFYGIHTLRIAAEPSSKTVLSARACAWGDMQSLFSSGFSKKWNNCRFRRLQKYVSSQIRTGNVALSVVHIKMGSP